MTTVKATVEYPKLYCQNSKGGVKVWQIFVEEMKDGTADIVTIHGGLGKKMQESRKTIYEGKNIGRANETTAHEQANAEAISAMNKKKDSGYVENLKTAAADETVKLPMLALVYADRKHNIQFPCYTQPKLEGVRCFATRHGKTIEYTSRKGKPFTTLDHLTPELLKILKDGETVDGELFNTKYTFQTLVSAIKNNKDQSNAEIIQYHVYDFPSEKGGFGHRFAELTKRIGTQDPFSDGQAFDYIRLVPTELAADEDQIFHEHADYCAAGYEGTMVRNAVGEYKYNHRSQNLLKLKDFVDDEYPIIGVEQGVGKDEGTATFVCKCPKTNQVFKARPRGTVEQRSEYWDNRDYCIGKQLTVRYQRLTDRGVPYLPVGITIRDYE